MDRGREGKFSVNFLRTPIVFWSIFYCSLTYAEGGRVKNLDIFAYVLNEWSHVTRGYLFRNKVTHEGESWEPNEICVVLWVPGALEGKAPVSVCQIRNAPGNRHGFHLHVPFDQMCLKDLPVLLRGILIPSLFSGVFSLFSLCFASLLLRLFNIDGSSISLDDLAA